MDSKNQSDISENSLLTNTVDHLNDADAELLKLLGGEDDCNDILQNIASNDHFDQLINNGSAFTEQTVIDELIRNESFRNSDRNILNSDVSLQENSEVDKGKGKKQGEFKCAECEKVCRTKKLLKYHLMSHSNLRPYSCDLCSKSFKHRYEVNVHKRTHSKPTFQCEICSKMFIHKSHLNVHRKKHLNKFVAFCNECNKGFVSEFDYKRHVNVRHCEPKHVCDVCGMQLKTVSSLKEHKLTHSPSYGQRLFICEICGKSYLNIRNLRAHLKLHTEKSSFMCNVCGKYLSDKKILNTHLKTHSGEKKFVCEFCSKSFVCKEYLKVHRRIHNGEKPFRCEICNKCFTQKSSLTIHIRFHNGEKPYKCECGKSFVTKTHLLKHCKTHDSHSGFDYVSQLLL